MKSATRASVDGKRTPPLLLLLLFVVAFLIDAGDNCAAAGRAVWFVSLDIGSFLLDLDAASFSCWILFVSP